MTDPSGKMEEPLCWADTLILCCPRFISYEVPSVQSYGQERKTSMCTVDPLFHRISLMMSGIKIVQKLQILKPYSDYQKAT